MFLFHLVKGNKQSYRPKCEKTDLNFCGIANIQALWCAGKCEEIFLHDLDLDLS